MANWGNTDDAANSVTWATTQVNLPANTSNQTALFGNTTQSAFTNGGNAIKAAVGQFGLDAAELSASSNASVISIAVLNPGSGYAANATVTLSGTATANATANATGRISAVNVTAAGSGYTGAPTITIAAPAAINIVSNTAGFSNTADTLLIATANSKFLAGDRVFYGVPTSNTPLAGLTGNTYYFVAAANTTTIQLSATQGGPAIDITDARNPGSPETHTITGQTATAAATLTGVPGRGGAHAGYVLRTVGSGGRAGRVQYETLVAMGSLTGDASDDTVLKDA